MAAVSPWVALLCVVCAPVLGEPAGAGLWGAPVGAGLWGAPAAYSLQSTLQLNDAARSEREVGYQLRAQLSVAPRWASSNTDYLLEFHLHSPKLYLRGKHVNADFMPHDSVWDSYTDSAFFAHWSNGLIKEAYLDPSDLPDVLNYKKALLSLFQVQMLEGEHNETDVSGSCLVLYETISTEVFRKIKRSCSYDAAGGVSSARRVARYTWAARAGLRALHAEELLLLGPAPHGLKARSWHTLARLEPAPSAASPAHSLQEALQALPAALRPLPLELQAAPGEDAGEDTADEWEETEGLSLSAALRRGAAALGGAEAGAGGGAEQAAAVLELLPALRRANHSALLELLQREDLHAHLPGLCRALGLAGSRASHVAARDFLQLDAHDPLGLAQHYLAAAAQALEPDDWVVLELLRLGDEARAADVRDAALLAAAAAAPAALQGGVRDALARGLARCRDEPCRALRLHALGNLRRADTADLLLQHAERDGARAQLAALLALRAAPPAALTHARLDRLQALALRERAALEVRAAALDLLVPRRAALPAPLAHVLRALHERGPHELRRVLWQRMAVEAESSAALRGLPALLEPELRGWDAAAHGGTSAVLAREPGWAAAGWRAQLQSVQVARDGLLRRGEVRLLALDPANVTYDALTVEVWTRGLEAFGGATGDASAEQAEQTSQPTEEPAGGLAFSVGGARMLDIPLFDGQAELLGHVWAGTGSSATPALRALRPLRQSRGGVPLLAGARAHVRQAAALALALDAQAQVSLWWRSARAELRLRAALAARLALRVRPAWGELRAAVKLRAAPRLRIAADLDFYSGVALCVRVATEPHELSRAVSLLTSQGARRLRVRRARHSRVTSPARTLALGRPNDVTCRTLRAADEVAPD